MAKKSTWEKRSKKVQKEEYLVLGGNTSKKKEGVKRKPKQNPEGRPAHGKVQGSRSDGAKSESSGAGKNYSRGRDERRNDGKSREVSGDTRTPRTRGGEKYGGSKFEKRGDSKPKFDPTQFLTRDGEDGRSEKFKNRGNAEKSFRSGDRKKSYSKFTNDKPFKGFEKKKTAADDGLIRLNKYLSMAGLCSRREADTFIANGLVTINGQVVTELGTKVKPTDVVEYAGEKVKTETLRYLLLNKPKDCITTLSDEKGRSTVIGLVKNACKERVFPVGRLDRNTTGLILLTNDGDLAKKLSHPSHEVRKVYHVITDKNVSIADLKKLETGIMLEDGMAKADAALFAGDGSVRNEIGLEIHSGRNRVVRRMFAALGYEVTKLDRAAFAGLSKKGLPRGRWRFLTEKEVGYLKML